MRPSFTSPLPPPPPRHDPCLVMVDGDAYAAEEIVALRYDHNKTVSITLRGCEEVAYGFTGIAEAEAEYKKVVSAWQEVRVRLLSLGWLTKG